MIYKSRIRNPIFNKMKTVNNNSCSQRFIILLFGLALLIGFRTFSQEATDDYRRFSVSDNVMHMLVGLSLSPGGENIAISAAKSYPMYIYNLNSKQVLKEFDVGNWYAGSRIKYSKTGKYLLIQQLYYVDWAPNKDREVNFEIIDAESGRMVKRFGDYHSVSITNDEQYALTLSGDEVAFWNLLNGKKEKSFSVPMASNAVAINPEMTKIAVSFKMDKKTLKKHPSMKNKKGKVIKKTAKYKQWIAVFDASTFEKLYTVDAMYDIIYKLEYSPDGKTLFCLHIPHLKAQTGLQRLTYINTINAESGDPLRNGFTSTATYEPEFKLSNNGKYLGVVSQGNRFVELHIYDFESGKMLQRFEQAFRLLEKKDGDLITPDSRTSFVFLPGDESVVMTMGNKLIEWNLNLK